jgi:hypothetical protein
MMHVAEWRKSSLSAKQSLCLLPRPRPLLTSTDVRQVQGGEPATKGGGRHGLRGGETALSPALTPIQRKMTIPLGQPAPVARSPLLRPPHLHKCFHPSWHLCHRLCCHHQSCRRHRSCRCHRSCHHIRHPRRGKGPRRTVKLRTPAVVLRFWPKKGKFCKSTDAFHCLSLRCLHCHRHHHPRRANLPSSSRTSHPCSRRHHQHL